MERKKIPLVPTSEGTKRRMTLEYLLTHRNPYERTQVSIMRALGMSQATLVRYLAELKGEGLIIEKTFGTAVIYEILYDVAIERGLVGKYELVFDLDAYLTAKGQPSNQKWVGKVFDFGDMVYVYLRHKDGFNLGIPIYDEDWKDLVKAAALGLNIEALFTALINYLGK